RKSTTGGEGKPAYPRPRDFPSSVVTRFLTISTAPSNRSHLSRIMSRPRRARPMHRFSAQICVLLLSALLFQACRKPSSVTRFVLSDPEAGIRVEVSPEDALPLFKVLLPGQPASDPGIRILFPEHVTAREHGKSDAVH